MIADGDLVCGEGPNELQKCRWKHFESTFICFKFKYGSVFTADTARRGKKTNDTAEI